MSCSNIVQFPGDQRVVARTTSPRKRRAGKHTIGGLADALMARAEATPARFHKLFLLRLEILVNELEMDVDKYSD